MASRRLSEQAHWAGGWPPTARSLVLVLSLGLVVEEPPGVRWGTVDSDTSDRDAGREPW
ncbi:hypothetical protein OFB99_26630 [Escherichia coli]|nr:hypothetical protein [Escherichia coli]